MPPSRARPPHTGIVAHYEACLARHGDTHRGVDWPNAEDAAIRYQVMLDVVREPPGTPLSLLDFGCGAAHLLDRIQAQGLTHLEYIGLDVSDAFIALCRTKHPQARFLRHDILAGTDTLPTVDYAVLNGVFTERIDLSQRAMTAYMTAVLKVLWPLVRRGMAFNVMSAHVDWQRDDLFHLRFDTLAALLTRLFGRHFVLRNDYGLYEYTAYVYRTPSR
ncbi:MAG: trans-aconitate 2-methyltransferase [Alphaproteobacteria bacterium]